MGQLDEHHRSSDNSMNTASSSRLCSCLTSSLRTRAAAQRIPSAQLFARREKHTLPNLPYSLDSSLEPFLSTKALRGTAVEWHQGNLDRLNDLVRGTPFENKSVARTIMDSSKRREDALVFGYASEALNNGFFLSGLTPQANTATSMSENAPQLSRAIQQSFGSETSFINHFSSYASGMFGTGYAWLVMDRVDNLAVLGTYGSGTVLVQGNEERARELEPFLPDTAEDASSVAQSEPTSSSPSSSSAFSSRASARQYHTSPSSAAPPPPQRLPNQTQNSSPSSGSLRFSGFLAGMGGSPSRTRGGHQQEQQRFVSIHPIFCLSLHPHVYLPDYGIMGKEGYVKNFWKNVDWARAERKFTDVKSIYGNAYGNAGAGRRYAYGQGNSPFVRHPMEDLPPREALNPNRW